jgi:hypothetical protein
MVFSQLSGWFFAIMKRVHSIGAVYYVDDVFLKLNPDSPACREGSRSVVSGGGAGDTGHKEKGS